MANYPPWNVEFGTLLLGQRKDFPGIGRSYQVQGMKKGIPINSPQNAGIVYIISLNLFRNLGDIASNISHRDPSLIIQASPWGVVVTFPISAKEILRVWNRAWRCLQCQGEGELVVELWMTAACVFTKLGALKYVAFPTLHEIWGIWGIWILSDTPSPKKKTFAPGPCDDAGWWSLWRC